MADLQTSALRKIALCYLRLSDREIKEVSIDIQKDACADWCRRLGLLPIFFEEGEGQAGQFSARKRTKLAVWAQVYQRALTEPTVAAIITYDLSRAFRRTETALMVAEELQKAGVQLVFTTDGIVSVNTPETKFAYTLKAAIAEYESFKATSRLLDHYAKVKARRGYAGHKDMFGLDRVGSSKDDSEAWIPDENFPNVLLILEWYAFGEYGAPAISEMLYQRGVRWRNRSDVETDYVHPCSIQRLLRRIDLYAPFVAEHDPTLVPRVKAILQTRAQRKTNHRKLKRPSYLLRGLLYCSHCGARYSQSAMPFKDKTRHHYYYSHMPRTGCPNNNAYVVRSRVDAEFAKLFGELYQLSRADLAAMFAKTNNAPAQPIALDLAAERARLEKRLSRYEEMFADDLMPRDRYLAQTTKIHAQIAALPEPQPETESADTPISPEQWADRIQSMDVLIAVAWTLEPDKTNHALRDLFARVEYDSEHITKITVRDGSILYQI